MSITPALYIVRKESGQPWELPVYFATLPRAKNWIDGHWIHSDAAILRHDEAKQVLERFPGSVMLRVG